MKRIVALLLVVIMICSFANVVFAISNDTALSCSVSETQLSPGDELTITVSLANSPNAKSVALVFDYDVTDTFTLIGGEWKLTGALLANFDSKTTACGTAAIAYMSPANVNGNIFTLKLKVKDSAPSGEKTISVSPVIKNDATSIACADTAVNVQIQTDTACNHTNKTLVNEQASTTDTQGWDTYYVCHDCGQLFASNGATEISNIPYRPLLSENGVVLSCKTDTTDIHPGDEVEIILSLKNSPNAKSIALVFDYDVTNTFTLVSGEWMLTGALLANFDSKTTACGTAAIAYMSPADVNGNIFKLKLKAKESAALGESIVNVSPVIKNDATTVECENAAITLTIAEAGCLHTNKVFVAEKESTCKEQGWDAYYRCPDCEQLFTSDGETEISEVPFRPFQDHQGGEATCKSLAVCSVCGQSYGNLNPGNHKGETETRGTVAPTCSSTGYTGDIYCKDCGKIITHGIVQEMLSHSFIDTITDPTQTTQGYTTHKCSECGYSYVDSYTDYIPENPIVVFVESKEVHPGKEFTVSVDIQNNSGFSYLELTPICPDEFTLVSAANGELISDFTKGKQYIWVSDEDVALDGKLMTITFRTSKDIEPGEYEVGFSVRSCVNYEEDIVDAVVEKGIIEVLNFTYGDVNGDNLINGQDVVRLKKYLANYDYDTETSTIEIFAGADANGDGTVNGQDVVRLKKYLANYDYDTGTSTIVLGPQN